MARKSRAGLAGSGLRGFAAMPLEQRRAIAALGGRAVAPEKRTFATQPETASRAGKVGGARSRVPSVKKAA